jgi:hypothetical protein
VTWLERLLLALLGATIGMLVMTLRKTPSVSPTSSSEVERLWDLVSRFVPPVPATGEPMPTSRRPDPDLVWNGMIEAAEAEDARQAFLESQALFQHPFETPEPDEAHHVG